MLFVGLIVAGTRTASDSSAVALADSPKNVPAELQISWAEEAMMKRLIDPDSVRFSGTYRGLVMRSKTGAATVCGYVNAKNGFGGYSGNARFIAAGDLTYLELDVAARQFQERVGRKCAVASDESSSVVGVTHSTQRIKWTPLTRLRRL